MYQYHQHLRMYGKAMKLITERKFTLGALQTRDLQKSIASTDHEHLYLDIGKRAGVLCSKIYVGRNDL